MTAKTIDMGPLQPLLDDPSVSEIMVNGPHKIFVEKKGKKILTDAKFPNEEELIKFMQRVYAAMGKRIDNYMPLADGVLEDGSRLNAILPPLAQCWPTLTIRKFSKDIKTMDDLIAVGAINEKAAEFLTACIKGKLNMLISGGTGVGKTTILQILLKEAAPRSDRIVTVEDTAELHLDQENLVPLETRVTDESGKGEITLRDLIRNALRMSPDRIIIGEVRGDEVVDMLQAMVTGHTGAIGIIHGNSPREVIARMETMVLMSGIRLPLSEIRKQIASTIHVVVHLARMSDGSKKVAQICEIRGIEREEVFFNDLFVYNVENITEEGKIVGSLKPAIRYYPLFYQRFLKMGILSDKVFAKEAAT